MMDNEIAQVIQMEIAGIKWVICAPFEIAQAFFRAIKAISDFSDTQQERRLKKEKIKEAENLERPGRHSVSEINKISEKYGMPMTLPIREDCLAELLEMAEKSGLRYELLPDMNAEDKMRHLYIPAQEVEIYNVLSKSILAKKLKEDERVSNGYEDNIAEVKEQMRHVDPDSEEYKALKVKADHFEQAKEEMDQWVKYGKETMDKENIAQSFTEYLRNEAQGTTFEEHPERAMAELEKGVEIGRKFIAKECLQPIRDKSYVPDTKYKIYLPENGSAITREFYIDSETDLAYSKYLLKTSKGETMTFFDNNVTREDWNQFVLPRLLDSAGIIEGTQCRIFDTKEKAVAYRKYHGNVKSEAEIKVEQAIKAKEPVFSSAEAQREVEYVLDQREKAMASAKINSDRVTITAEPDSVRRHNGKLYLQLENGDALLFNQALEERIDNKGHAVWEVEKDADVLYLRSSNSPNASPEPVPVRAEECKDIMNRSADVNQVPVNHHSHKQSGR